MSQILKLKIFTGINEVKNKTKTKRQQTKKTPVETQIINPLKTKAKIKAKIVFEQNIFFLHIISHKHNFISLWMGKARQSNSEYKHGGRSIKEQ